MTDYSELVKALRCCGDVGCHKCPYQKHIYEHFCWTMAMHDAAAAIEVLQAELGKEGKRVEHLLATVNELEDKMPKRGEWVTIRLNNGGSYTGCSCCEAPIPTDTMLDYIPESESKYCYSCGAKMEVQDV